MHNNISKYCYNPISNCLYNGDISINQGLIPGRFGSICFAFPLSFTLSYQNYTLLYLGKNFIGGFSETVGMGGHGHEEPNN
ncbi:hypothetical protein MKW92_041806 [Papaver armeniacum]|nr:hypothetical protein MKW92_041806 [Papaver armeniacum]